jgi:hypothetical protein
MGFLLEKFRYFCVSFDHVLASRSGDRRDCTDAGYPGVRRPAAFGTSLECFFRGRPFR